MKRISYLLAFALSAGAAAATGFEKGFDLVKENDGKRICRIASGEEKRCLPALEVQGVNTDRVELTERLKAYRAYLARKKADPAVALTMPELDALGGAFFLSEAEVNKTLADWRELSVRKLAVGFDQARVEGDHAYVPFFASLRWKGRALHEGTLNLEGELKLSATNELRLRAEDSAEELRAKIDRVIELRALSDSGTEQGLAVLRGLETSLRRSQFVLIGLDARDADADEATTRFVRDVVTPMVVGEVAYVPVMKAMMGSLVDAIGEALGGAVEQKRH